MAGSKKKQMNPVVTAVKGAVIGGIAVAAAMTLADEKKMGEIKGSIADAKGKVVDFAQGKKEAVMKSAESIKDTLGKAAEDVKDEIM